MIRTDDRNYKLIWSNHHILLDGWSRAIILNELFQIYSSGKNGKDYQLEEPSPYSDYINWLRDQNQNEGIEYWKKYLKEYEQKAQLPKLQQPSSRNRFMLREKLIKFSEDFTSELTQLANRNNVTINTVLQSVWGILLAKYNNVDDIVFGTVVSGRDANVKGIENMVGIFINTIPTRIKLKNNKSFKDNLKVIQNRAIESNKYNYMNLSEVQSLTKLKRDLIDHVMVFENYSMNESNQAHKMDTGFVFKSLEGKEQTNYGFSIVAAPGKELMIKLTYDKNLYHEKVVNNIEKHMRHVMKQIVEDQEILISQIKLYSEEEKNLLVNQCNQKRVSYPGNKAIHHLFEEQVERTPYHTAVVCEEQDLTYQSINEKANQLARCLQEKGVRTGTIVGILADRSPEMIVGIMGVLKAGGAYVPIDPAYPEDRMAYILEDSQTAILLQDKRRGHIIGEREVIGLEEDFSRYSTENLETLHHPDHLAYIIYTSGSTGQPKGVMITHNGLVNYVSWAAKKYVQGEAVDFPLYSSIAFDLTVTSIFTPLISGNKILVYRGDTDEPLIRKVFKDNKAGVVKLTPSHLSLIKDLDNRHSRIKRLIVGGEDLKSKLAEDVYTSFDGDVEIYNEYGPTETVVGCMLYQYNPDRDQASSVPIGKPADNVEIYILDQEKEISPPGVVGELYIGGEGVGKGYLNRVKLTEKKFIPHPFKPGEKLYRTGDLARRLHDGHIEFLGRTDHQVKIRGYRIELGEIENQLLKQPEIKEAVVVSRETRDHDNQLCAYLVMEEEETDCIISTVKERLTKKLPGYMVPSFFMKLKDLPLTPNGKVEFNALPRPEQNFNVGKYKQPGNELEKKILVLWKSILKVEQLSVDTNLIDMGANSLNIMSFISRLNLELDFELPIRSVFENPTIALFAKFLKGAKDLLKNYTDECIQLTNSTRSNKKLFFFPPAASVGIAYMAISQYLDDYSTFSFNFIKAENRIKEYVDIITGIQEEGPFTLVGYSSGGVLAFEVAKELINRGYKVDNLIIIDSKYRMTVEK